MLFNNFDFNYECSTNNFFRKFLNKIVLKDRVIMSRSFGRGLQLLNSIEHSLFSSRDFANLKEVLNTYKHPNEIYLDAQNKFGDSALHICVQNEALDFLKCIIEKGANVNIKTAKGIPLCLMQFVIMVIRNLFKHSLTLGQTLMSKITMATPL